ncbi:DUF4145 domain-containing protein [Alteromonas naphthalenivorans]|jgi:hypothetical protein|uniref:DUF4145 domain-containing protein n=1 Tax=Alteromonas naphthalenivorans TaxID=715451 RepID=F5Z883_ALTNA|nr:DUF4145 domain-containing protein [Alteromonas naphthalenivorans]AEF03276.1 hypothetical protein ambt_08750 [Alteromonas naphthalenivorans]|tara:strand:- start:2583 stop:3260 length:678 start_codon:yes stop_codon:yes gene_type:complete
MEEIKLKAQCNKCLGETNHLLLHKEDQPWDEEIEHYTIHGSETFNMVKCCGCDSVKLMHSSWFSEICDEYGRPIIEISYYPPAISRAEPKWLSEIGGLLPNNEMRFVRGLIKEIYSALHNDSRRLAAMGIRALIEHMMILEVTDNGSFKKNLEAFQKAGYLSDKQRTIIEPILEAGHAAIHRGYEPSSEDVITVIEITESLVETIYVHSKKAEKLKERVPQRGNT